MKVWYMHVEGRCQGNYAIRTAFGFFVHALIEAADEDEAKRLVADQLQDEGMDVCKYRWCGVFDDFAWDDADLEREVTALAHDARARPGEAQFSDFDSWSI